MTQSKRRGSAANNAISRMSVFAGAALITASCLAPAARADFSDVLRTLRPYAEVGFSHDSNLFRLPDLGAGQQIFGEENLSDDYSTLTVGFDGELERSEQRLTLNGRVFRNGYSRFDQVDYTGGNANVLLNWTAGDLWSGEVGAQYDRRLRDFANQITPRVDLSDRGRLLLGVGRRLSDRIRLAVNANYTDVEFDEEQRLDLNRTTFGLELTFSSRADNSVSLMTEHLDVEYLGLSASGVNLDYSELRLGPTGDWEINDGLRLRAVFAALQRQYDATRELDFEGLTGRVTATWRRRNEGRLDAYVWRELSTLGDEIANYAVIEGIGIEPSWQVGSRTRLGFVFSYQQRDFKGEPALMPIGLDLESRTDDIASAAFTVDWTPLRNASFSLHIGTEDRDSTQTAKDYQSEIVALTVKVGFL